MNTPSTRPLTLHLVTDPRIPRERLLDAVRAAVDNGVDWVQVRDNDASAGDLFDLATLIVGTCRGSGTRVAVNDRVDVALAVGADGVQVGGRGLPVAAVRRIAPSLRIGVSVHDVEAARRAMADGADWVTFGHVYATPSHPGEPARGIDRLVEVVRAVNLPVIAIGGIGPDQIAAVRAAGAGGIAVISAILGADDPGQATRELRARLKA